MKQDTLSHLIGCAKTRRRGDAKLCQDFRDDIPDSGTEDYWKVLLKNKADGACRSARQVLLAGSDYYDCKVCGMKGVT